jgi:hypothetical protein
MLRKGPEGLSLGEKVPKVRLSLREGPEGLSLGEKVPKVRLSWPRPRLWHKVEHVHPGALRGRAVGSAPSILENARERSLSCTSVSASKTRRRSLLAAPGLTEVSPWSACCLPRASRAPFRVHHERPTSGFLPSLRSGRSLPGPLEEPPIAHGIPLPRYSARRTRTLHSDPKARALSSSGPGFSPVARLACRVVLRSCFRPGTRLGLPRHPPRVTFLPVRDRGSGEPGRVRRPFPAVARERLPT